MGVSLRMDRSKVQIGTLVAEPSKCWRPDGTSLRSRTTGHKLRIEGYQRQYDYPIYAYDKSYSPCLCDQDRVEHRLKLRELRILLAVVKAGSMAKAATDLAISQPNVSKAIADLEHSFSVRLLDRSSRGIEPTTYGLAVIKRATAMFDELRQSVKEVEFLD